MRQVEDVMTACCHAAEAAMLSGSAYAVVGRIDEAAIAALAGPVAAAIVNNELDLTRDSIAVYLDDCQLTAGESADARAEEQAEADDPEVQAEDGWKPHMTKWFFNGAMHTAPAVNPTKFSPHAWHNTGTRDVQFGCGRWWPARSAPVSR